MEKITYIIGAGFSRNAGVPVMADFLFRAKDMYFAGPERYAYLSSLFEQIDRLNKVKGYYYSDLFNIEEILSIMEMQEAIGTRSNLRRNFIKMIVDVVESYSYGANMFHTMRTTRPGNWHDWIFSQNRIVQDYSTFITSLMGIGLKLDKLGPQEIFRAYRLTDANEYSVISFNYDMIVEMTTDFLRANSIDENGRQFEPRPILSKLHGSIHDNSIVPPTWAKSIQPNLKQAWKTAFKNLQDANQIRIVGYSLPITDSYFRYFLKAAIVNSKNLRSIDVMCFDPSGAVEQNYREFVSFSRMRFCNVKFEDYLQKVTTHTSTRMNNHTGILPFASIDEIHTGMPWK